MKWKYTRVKSAKCSKWVKGDNWVTKHDGEKFCHVGINGKPNRAWMIESPSEARKCVESILGKRQLNQTQNEAN
jgi:hypothetical protein